MPTQQDPIYRPFIGLALPKLTDLAMKLSIVSVIWQMTGTTVFDLMKPGQVFSRN
jgi:hypothetical protein